MNEPMCLAEDLGINIFYQDTDSMHLPEDDVPRLEEAFAKKYGRQLNGKNMSQFHPDFEIKDRNGNKLDHYTDIRSIEGIFVGKKSYLDVLEAKNTQTGKVEQHLHVRMKGIPTQIVKRTASLRNPNPIQGVRELYLDLLNGKIVEFDLTANGTKTCFDVASNFTVKSKQKFDRCLKFKSDEVIFLE